MSDTVDFIALAAEFGDGGSVEIVTPMDSDAPLPEVLEQLRRFLVAIGYDQVIEVSATIIDDDDGADVTISSEDVDDEYDGYNS